MARGEYELADHEWSGAFLFMDVKGFTAFSESRAAAEVVRTLNAIFSPATRTRRACEPTLARTARPALMFAEAERRELTVKGRARTVVAYECRSA